MIVGIKEGEEKGCPTDFVCKLIPELLGQDNFSRPVKIDRAQRSLRPKPQPNERPRIIIAKVHNDWDVIDILRLSRLQAPLTIMVRESQFSLTTWRRSRHSGNPIQV